MRSTHQSMRASSLGPDSRIHLGAHRASAPSSLANRSGSVIKQTVLTIVITMRMSMTPVKNTAISRGSFSRR